MISSAIADALWGELIELATKLQFGALRLRKSVPERNQRDPHFVKALSIGMANSLTSNYQLCGGTLEGGDSGKWG